MREFPNKVDLTAIEWDDNFTDYDEAKYTVVAQKSTKDRAEILMIENGNGLYIITGIDPRPEPEEAKKLFENVLTFFVSALAVQPADKLPVVWGGIKSDLRLGY